MSLLKRQAILALLFCSLLAVALTSCTGGDDKPIMVKATDAEMNVAIAHARELLPQFWQAFDHPKGDERDFALKVRIKDEHGTEHFWAADVERKDGKIFGTINNDAEIVKNVKLGDHIEIPEADISDWLYMRNGKMMGNYTLRVLFKEMSPKEVEFYKQKLADP